MRTSKVLLLLWVALILAPTRMVWATPSGGTYPPVFTHKNGWWYDSWGVTRDDPGGPDGYVPLLYSETLGENRELAYGIGVWFGDNYSDRTWMAEAILRYVQTNTEYGYDVDNVVMGGQAQEEWAWNADEMAHMYNTTRGVRAIGDCEDMAYLCATIYEGAGFETAIVDATDHLALLIGLPDYPNANAYWELSDGKGQGWIWVEATGEANPLGWTPPDYMDGSFVTYKPDLAEYEVANGEYGDLDFTTIAFIVLVALSVLMRLSGRTRRY